MRGHLLTAEQLSSKEMEIRIFGYHWNPWVKVKPNPCFPIFVCVFANQYVKSKLQLFVISVVNIANCSLTYR